MVVGTRVLKEGLYERGFSPQKAPQRSQKYTRKTILHKQAGSSGPNPKALETWVDLSGPLVGLLAGLASHAELVEQLVDLLVVELDDAPAEQCHHLLGPQLL